MGQILSDVFTKNHFVMPTKEIWRPMLLMFGILISLIVLFCITMNCPSCNRESEAVLAAQQNGGAVSIPLQNLQNAEEFPPANNENFDAASLDNSLDEQPSFRENHHEPPGQSNAVKVQCEYNEATDSDSYYATIRPTPDICIIPRLIAPTFSGSDASNLDGPLKVSTLKEDKKVRFSNKSLAGSKFGKQSSCSLVLEDELNEEELDYDLFRPRESNAEVSDNDSLCTESYVNLAYVSEPIIPPVDYNVEPYIPPVDYSDDEPSIDNQEEMVRSDYIVEGAVGGYSESGPQTPQKDNKLDDDVEDALGTLDEVLEAASLPTAVLEEQNEGLLNTNQPGKNTGYVRILKMIPKS